MKRRDFAIAGTSLTGALLLGCSEGTDGEMMGTGGASTGGAGTGGVGTGGAGTGGVATGGAATGGAATGGAATGGAATGGAATGGAATGGDASTGGAATGGDASTGGAGSGGDTSSGGDGSGGETNTGGGGGEMCASIMIDISNPHMHTMEVTPEEVAAGVEKTYDIQGDNEFHGHTVVVTAAHFAMLAGGGMVEIESTTDGQPAHPHTVTIVCTV